MSISLAEVAEGVKKLLSSKAPGVEKICSEILKAFDIVGRSLQCCVDVGDNTCGMAGQGGGSHF